MKVHIYHDYIHNWKGELNRPEGYPTINFPELLQSDKLQYFSSLETWRSVELQFHPCKKLYIHCLEEVVYNIFSKYFLIKNSWKILQLIRYLTCLKHLPKYPNQPWKVKYGYVKFTSGSRVSIFTCKQPHHFILLGLWKCFKDCYRQVMERHLSKMSEKFWYMY